MKDKLTYYQDIIPMFSQWEVFQMLAIPAKLNLWDYNSVKAKAELIYNSFLTDDKRVDPYKTQLVGIDPMPLVIGPWPDDWIQIFRTWVDDGCLEGTAPVTPPADDQTPGFIELSKVLTGYDGEGPDEIDNPLSLAELFSNLGPIYQDRIKKESDHREKWNSLIANWEEIRLLPKEQLNAAVAEIMDQSNPLSSLAKDIITIWYTSAVNGHLGTPEYNQYKYGLAWRVIWAHPQGYADSVRSNIQFYWELEPKLGRSKDPLHTGQNLPTFPTKKQLA